MGNHSFTENILKIAGNSGRVLSINKLPDDRRCHAGGPFIHAKFGLDAKDGLGLRAKPLLVEAWSSLLRSGSAMGVVPSPPIGTAAGVGGENRIERRLSPWSPTGGFSSCFPLRRAIACACQRHRPS